MAKPKQQSNNGIMIYGLVVVIVVVVGMVLFSIVGSASQSGSTADTEAVAQTDDSPNVVVGDPNAVDVVDSELSGTLEEICEAATPAIEPDNRAFTQAEEVLEDGVDYQAIFCTSVGPIYVDLYEEDTPVTVNNFVFLAQQNYYNNTTFHRVIENFMAQGGDPTGTGTGGPGYRFQDEFVGNLTFESEGLLAMANAGPGTNGSQFFITFEPTPNLNNRHTIFGAVIEDQETVESIALRDPQTATTVGTIVNTVVIITDSAQVQ